MLYIYIIVYLYTPTGLSVSSSDSGKKADLGDIVVDTDQHALDDFLQEEDTTPSVEAGLYYSDCTKSIVIIQ